MGIIAESIPNLMKTINLETQEFQRTQYPQKRYINMYAINPRATTKIRKQSYGQAEKRKKGAKNKCDKRRQKDGTVKPNHIKNHIKYKWI